MWRENYCHYQIWNQLISEIFVPMIPAIIAAGLFNGFGSLLSRLLGDGVVSGSGFKMLQLILRFWEVLFWAILQFTPVFARQKYLEQHRHLAVFWAESVSVPILWKSPE